MKVGGWVGGWEGRGVCDCVHVRACMRACVIICDVMFC